MVNDIVLRLMISDFMVNLNGIPGTEQVFNMLMDLSINIFLAFVSTSSTQLLFWHTCPFYGFMLLASYTAPVNVSWACITIPASYVCVFRWGTAQDQPFQDWGLGVWILFLPFFTHPFPPLKHSPYHQGGKEVQQNYSWAWCRIPNKGQPITGGYKIYLQLLGPPQTNKQTNKIQILDKPLIYLNLLI